MNRFMDWDSDDIADEMLFWKSLAEEGNLGDLLDDDEFDYLECATTADADLLWPDEMPF